LCFVNVNANMDMEFALTLTLSPEEGDPLAKSASSAPSLTLPQPHTKKSLGFHLKL
jgi:hypothetical protein